MKIGTYPILFVEVSLSAGHYAKIQCKPVYSHPLPSNKICLPDCVWSKGATVRRLGKLLKRKQAVGKLSIWVTSWEDNYERHIRFRSPHSNFRAITRLETLATQAMRRSKTSLLKYHLSGAVCVCFFSRSLQAMARVWRDGQKKTVYIYRLLTTVIALEFLMTN